jgi:hypothetical protein
MNDSPWKSSALAGLRPRGLVLDGEADGRRIQAVLEGRPAPPRRGTELLDEQAGVAELGQVLADAVVVELHVGRDLRHAHRIARLRHVPEDAVAGGIAERTSLALQQAVGIGVSHPSTPLFGLPPRSSVDSRRFCFFEVVRRYRIEAGPRRLRDGGILAKDLLSLDLVKYILDLT